MSAKTARARGRWECVAALLAACVAVGTACAPPVSSYSSDSALSGDGTSGDDDDSTAKKKTPAPATSGAGGLSNFFGDDDDDDDNQGGHGGPGGGHHRDAGGGITVTKLDPPSSPPESGSTGLPLTVTGTGFDGASVVVFNGKDVPTKLVSPTSLQATVPLDMLATPGALNVTVRGMAGQSAPTTFIVTGSTDGTACGADFYTCAELGLQPTQCGQVDGDTVQCLSDGCVYVQCSQ